jgi:hypothetical protein
MGTSTTTMEPKRRDRAIPPYSINPTRPETAIHRSQPRGAKPSARPYIPESIRKRYYSYRSASIGSSAAAFQAG